MYRTCHYKDYEIKANPIQLKDGTWCINLDIYYLEGDKIVDNNYSSERTFQTEEEATKHCLIFGRQIINNNDLLAV